MLGGPCGGGAPGRPSRPLPTGLERPEPLPRQRGGNRLLLPLRLPLRPAAVPERTQRMGERSSSSPVLRFPLTGSVVASTGTKASFRSGLGSKRGIPCPCPNPKSLGMKLLSSAPGSVRLTCLSPPVSTGMTSLEGQDTGGAGALAGLAGRGSRGRTPKPDHGQGPGGARRIWSVCARGAQVHGRERARAGLELHSLGSVHSQTEARGSQEKLG